MAIASSHEFHGSVSGGCVDAKVIAEAVGVLATGKPATTTFEISDQSARLAGAACGGRMTVHISRLDPKNDLALLRSIDAATANRTPLVVATLLSDGRGKVVSQADARCPHEVEALATGNSAIAESPNGQRFLHAFVPTPRLVIVGATGIGQHLADMATAAGYEVKVIDPRGGCANSVRFSPAKVIDDWPHECLAKLADDPFAAIVTLTHVDDIDDAALAIALKSNCRYIGSLGSRMTHAKRVARLKALGFGDEVIARVHAPVGLDIGAETPGEIAASILAQIITVFRKGAGHHVPLQSGATATGLS